MTKFLIIDGNSIAYRAAVASSPNKELINSKGKITGGIFRFVNILNKILTLTKPTHVIVGFDTSKKTFRNELYSEYKANRKSKNEGEDKDIYSQFSDIKKVLEAIGIKHDNILDYEGDDIVGTYCNISNANKNFVLSGDKDTFQLINDDTFVIFPIKGISEVAVYNKDKFMDRFDVNVEQYIDYKCLLGDKGDNIPGVNGCGDKSAASILKKYSNIDNLLKNLDEQSKDIRGWKKLSNNLKEWQTDYPLMKKLVTIRNDVPIKYSFDDCKISLNWNNAIPLFEELEFNSLIKRVKGGKLYK